LANNRNFIVERTSEMNEIHFRESDDIERLIPLIVERTSEANGIHFRENADFERLIPLIVERTSEMNENTKGIQLYRGIGRHEKFLNLQPA
jgi:hypothetical protein